MCPDRKTLQNWTTGQLPTDKLEQVFTHVESCSECRKKIDTLKTNDSLLDGLGGIEEIITLSASCERMIQKSQQRLQVYFDDSQEKTVPRLTKDRIRDYVLRELLGMGGMGAVYRAEHERLGREVAIKIISPQYLNSQAAAERFEREMSALGKLSHPNIVTALDAGCEDGVHYLVMDLIEGFNCNQLVELLGPLPFAEAVKITLLAAKGMQHAHQQGFVHRDMKPSNLMVTLQGNVQVLDLGLSLWGDVRTQIRAYPKVLGTLDYMAPEQLLDSERVDHRADIYSLGNTFHFLIYGCPAKPRLHGEIDPHEHRLPNKIEKDILQPGLEAFLNRMLAESPDDRPASAAEVVQQLAPWGAEADLTSLVARAKHLAPERVADTVNTIPSAWLETRRQHWRNQLSNFLSRRATVILIFVMACGLLGAFALDFFKNKSVVERPGNSLTARRSVPFDQVVSPSLSPKQDRVKRSPVSDPRTSPRPKLIVPADFRGEQDLIHEAIVEDSQGEWMLRMGSLSGVRVVRKPQGAGHDSQIVWSSIDVNKFQNEHPSEYAMVEKYLPAENLFIAPLIDFKKPLPPEVRMRRAVLGMPMGGQHVFVQTRRQQIFILDFGIAGGIQITITSNGETSKYHATNRPALRRDNPEIAVIADRYAKPRVFEFPKPNVTSIPLDNLKAQGIDSQGP